MLLLAWVNCDTFTASLALMPLATPITRTGPPDALLNCTPLLFKVMLVDPPLMLAELRPCKLAVLPMTFTPLSFTETWLLPPLETRLVLPTMVLLEPTVPIWLLDAWLVPI